MACSHLLIIINMFLDSTSHETDTHKLNMLKYSHATTGKKPTSQN